MRSLLDWIRGRLLPALVTAAGVALLAAGLLTYQDPPQAVATVAAIGDARAERRLRRRRRLPLASLAPPARRRPSTGPTADPRRDPRRRPGPADRPAGRRPPDDPDHFPYCDVAEYLPELEPAGLARARPTSTPTPGSGMFLPLLETADAKMLGMLVQVYTSDNQVFLYEITRVLRHQTSLDVAFAATDEQLMLQTSEGPTEGPARLHRPRDDARRPAAQRRAGRPDGREPDRRSRSPASRRDPGREACPVGDGAAAHGRRPSDPVDPAQDDRDEHGQRGDPEGDDPEARAPRPG